MTGRDEGGFTLLELMVVVLILAVLLAIAVPTLAGAMDRASERAAQSDVRNALANQIVFYSDAQVFSQSTTAMAAVDSSLTWVNAIGSLDQPRSVYVEVKPTYRADDTVVLGARAGSGSCFWLRTVGDRDLPRFAVNDCADVPSSFGDAWS